MKIVNTKTLAKNKFLDFKLTEYVDQKGNTKYWTWVSRPNGIKAVVIAAIVDKGYYNNPNGGGYLRDLRLVVIKEFRVAVGDYEYSIPAGLIDEGEDIVGAASRELFEETGLKIKSILRVSPFVYNSAGLSDEAISMVYAECEGDISKVGHEDSEDIEVFLMNQNEVIKLLEDNTKKFSAKFWIIAQYFARNNSLL
jgi:ADP-ribose pyrophosphatase